MSALAGVAVWLALLIVATELLIRLWRGWRGARPRGWSVGLWHAGAGLGLVLALQEAMVAGRSWAVLAWLAASGLAHALALAGERAARRQGL